MAYLCLVRRMLARIMSFITSLIGWVLQALDARRRVRCTVHKAVFSNAPQNEHFFITVTNLSHAKELEITHIWFDTTTRIDVMNPARPLPKRFKPDETWTTWIEVTRIPATDRDDTYTKARVRLSTGKIVTSHKAKEIPPQGNVAG